MDDSRFSFLSPMIPLFKLLAVLVFASTIGSIILLSNSGLAGEYIVITLIAGLINILILVTLYKIIDVLEDLNTKVIKISKEYEKDNTTIKDS